MLSYVVAAAAGHQNVGDQASCGDYSGRGMFKRWKESRFEVANENQMGHSRITGYQLHDFKYTPIVHVYEHVRIVSLQTQPLVIQTDFPADAPGIIDGEDNQRSGVQHSGPTLEQCDSQAAGTFYHVGRFDPDNPFEGMHAYVNVFASLALLGINPGAPRFEH